MSVWWSGTPKCCLVPVGPRLPASWTLCLWATIWSWWRYAAHSCKHATNDVLPGIRDCVQCAARSCYSQVRLLELYDTVDLFVLYEIPYTHLGAVKPFYFNDSLTGGWWLEPC